jgi:hypothetical protein
MTPETAQEIIKHITQHLHFSSGDSFGTISWGADQDVDWAQTWLSRFALLAGSVDAVEFVTGTVVDDDDRKAILGKVVVFTPTLLISGEFSADTRTSLAPVGLVTARARADVVSISVENTDRIIPGRTDESWPRRLRVSIALRDGTTLELPTELPGSRPTPRALVDFLPRLIVS